MHRIKWHAYLDVPKALGERRSNKDRGSGDDARGKEDRTKLTLFEVEVRAEVVGDPRPVVSQFLS